MRWTLIPPRDLSPKVKEEDQSVQVADSSRVPCRVQAGGGQMTVIKVNLQACLLKVCNKQDAGEHEDQSKVIKSTEQTAWCLKLDKGLHLLIFSLGESGNEERF